MAISNLTPVEPWPSRKLPQDRFDASVKTAMDQMSVMVGELNSSFIPAVNETAESINTLNPDLPAILDAPNQAAAAAASAEAAAGSAGAAAESVTAAAREVQKAKTEVERAKTEADRAKQEADRAQSIAGVGPATVDALGLVKPDGATTQTDAAGTLSVPTFKGSTAGLVPAATSADAKKVLLGDGTWGSVQDDASVMSVSEDIHLTADSPRSIVLTAEVPNLSIYLPDPSTLSSGTIFRIFVRPLDGVTLRVFSGDIVKAYPLLDASSAYFIQLVDASTGLWALAKYDSGSTSDAQGKSGLSIGGLTIFCSEAISYLSMAALSETKAIVCYQGLGNSKFGVANILTISDTGLSVSSSTVFNSSETYHISVVALSQTKAIVCFKKQSESKTPTFVCVLSISDTTINAGDILSNSEVADDSRIIALSETKALLYAIDNNSPYYLVACVLSISDTTISAGSTFKSNIGDSIYYAAALSETKVVFCSYSTPSYVSSFVLSISDMDIREGVKMAVSDNGSNPRIAALSETKAIVCFRKKESPYNLLAAILNISDMTISVGEITDINAVSTDEISVAALSETKAVVCYLQRELLKCEACLLTVYDTTVSVTSSIVFNSSKTSYMFVDSLAFPGIKAVVAFYDTTNYVGKAGVLYFA